MRNLATQQEFAQRRGRLFNAQICKRLRALNVSAGCPGMLSQLRRPLFLPLTSSSCYYSPLEVQTHLKRK